MPQRPPSPFSGSSRSSAAAASEKSEIQERQQTASIIASVLTVLMLASLQIQPVLKAWRFLHTVLHTCSKDAALECLPIEIDHGSVALQLPQTQPVLQLTFFITKVTGWYCADSTPSRRTSVMRARNMHVFSVGSCKALPDQLGQQFAAVPPARPCRLP